jgi:site-specific recombinase XerC
LPQIHFHDLRHSMASNMVNSVIDTGSVWVGFGWREKLAQKTRNYLKLIRFSHWFTSFSD